jgi:geranylgeranyl diphosphate synthase, type II
MPDFADRLKSYQDEVEEALPDFFPTQPAGQGGRVVEAAQYSLLGGGKRIRPALLLAVCDMLGHGRSVALPFACALEMIHTYSLIHDDLPCMDDDDLRRGRPTCHKAFGEAWAVLAGDALLNRAFEIMLDAISPANPGTLAAARLIGQAAGSRGMIGGQALDIAAKGRSIALDDLKTLHRMKTGALLWAPILAGAALAGADPAVTGLLDRYAGSIGLAFQIQDDILDATSDSQMLGKSAGKDERDNKPTYVSLLGLDDARTQLADAIRDAQSAAAGLAKHGLDTGFLTDLAHYLEFRPK